MIKKTIWILLGPHNKKNWFWPGQRQNKLRLSSVLAFTKIKEDLAQDLKRCFKKSNSGWEGRVKVEHFLGNATYWNWNWIFWNWSRKIIWQNMKSLHRTMYNVQCTLYNIASPPPSRLWGRGVMIGRFVLHLFCASFMSSLYF